MVDKSKKEPRILAVDGGNSKTDVVLVDRDGHVLVGQRVAVPANLGLDHEGATQALDAAIRSVTKGFGGDHDGRPVADIGVYCLAGADFPVDERRIHRDLTSLGWTARSLVRNDTLAVLRAGTDRGWGIAVVCGGGMNAAGVAPDGRVVRFPALGEVSGDLAPGGGWIGMMGLAYAVRAEDGRGEPTSLRHLVPAYFKLKTPAAVTEAIYLGRIPMHRIHELAPLVFAAARRRDRVARSILDRVADEVVVFAVATVKRLQLTSRDVDVVLGGGVFEADDPNFHRRISSGIRKVAPNAKVRRLQAPPVVGAALLGLDEVGAARTSGRETRRAVTSARLNGTGSFRSPG